MIAVFLANGFEEIEALATVDILRRAGLAVCTVGVDADIPIGAHNMPIRTDISQEKLDLTALSAIVLPGGMPGTRNLDASPVVHAAIDHAVCHKLPIGAICAAPSILGRRGLLQGKQAVCYPGFETALIGADISEKAVITDGQFTTARGAGVAIDFALELVRILTDEQTALTVRGSIQCR